MMCKFAIGNFIINKEVAVALGHGMVFLGFLHSFTSVAMVSRVGACDRWGGAESGQTRRRSRDGARVARAG